MKKLLLSILFFLAACSSNVDNYPSEILGEWEVYSLDGDTDLYKTFVGVRYTFKADGTFTRSKGDDIRVSGTYVLDGENIVLQGRREHKTEIVIKGDKLTFAGDSGFKSGGVPMKSVYKKVN